jgi:hypothetical protein
MKTSLSKLERVPLREALKHQANDFTPWLAEFIYVICTVTMDVVFKPLNNN